MKSCTILFVIALVVFSASEVSAQKRDWSYFIDAAQLERRCNAPGGKGRAICEAYIAGVFDALNATADVRDDAVLLAKCAGKEISLPDARRAVAKTLSWMHSIGLAVGKPASRIVVPALHELCEPMREKLDRIRRQLGTEPPRGTLQFKIYIRIKTCMILLNLPEEECRRIEGEAR